MRRRRLRAHPQQRRPCIRQKHQINAGRPLSRWFEPLVIGAILLVAIVCGVEYSTDPKTRDPGTAAFIELTNLITLLIFNVECVVKILGEAETPQVYFTRRDDGTWNTFDFTAVLPATH